MLWPSGNAQRYGLYLATFLMILKPRIILLGKGTPKDYQSVLDGTADFAILQKTFVEQYPDSEFIRTFKANHSLFDSIYLPQYGDEPIAWIFDAQSNRNGVN